MHISSLIVCDVHVCVLLVVKRVPGVGRLLVVLLEGCDLRACDSTGMIFAL